MVLLAGLRPNGAVAEPTKEWSYVRVCGWDHGWYPPTWAQAHLLKINLLGLGLQHGFKKLLPES